MYETGYNRVDYTLIDKLPFPVDSNLIGKKYLELL